jgi:hypothetical protein
MLRILILALGVFIVLLGLQCFVVYEITVTPFIVQQLKLASPTIKIPDYLPYSFLCVGIVLFYYGCQTKK